MQRAPEGSPGWRARLRYKFDNTVAKGTAALIAWLALITGVLIVVAAVVVAAFGISTGDGHVGFVEAAWLSLLRTLDPGTMGGDQGWPFRLVSLAVTLGGIFIVSALIGLLSTGLDQKIGELRKGRSPVIERNHTLILGWSPKLFAVVSELVIANENQRDACVVVMADRDKVEMEDELRARLGDTRTTRVVCRTGQPSDPGDLALVRPRDAKAVIVLCPEEDDGDAEVVRTILALLSIEGQGFGGVPVVAELADAASAQALRLATEGRVATVVSTQIISRVTAQVCRQSGLSVIYQELLDFDGDEIYFQPAPTLAGRTFAQALLSYEDSAVIGVRFADGRVELAPPMDTVLGADDQVIAISRDDDTVVVRAGGPMEVDGVGPVPSAPDVPRPEEILVLGWNGLGPRVLRELDRYVPAGSRVQLVVDPRYVDRAALGLDGDGLRNLTTSVAEGDTTTPEPLAACMAGRALDHVVILCYRDGLTAAESDARTLLTLLQMRQLLRHRPEIRENLTVVSELLDVRDIALARATEVDDFIVSERLTSLMIAQLAENVELDAVFEQLFSADGAEIAMQPARLYTEPGRTVTFAAAVRAGQERGDVVIGFRHGRSNGAGEGDGDGTGDGGDDIVLNPPKATTVALDADDQLIVLRRHGPATP